MAKFNEVQKKKRAQNQEKKRRIHGDPVSGKLHLKQQPVSISGKRKRKLEKKWRRDQKEAVEKGLITMEDVEMAAAADDNEESQGTKRGSKKFHMKKSIKLKQGKHRGKKNGKSSKPASAAQASVDVMVE